MSWTPDARARSRTAISFSACPEIVHAERLHPFNFVRGGVPREVLAHHPTADRAMSGVRRDVDRDRLVFEPGEH
ncbi:MAG: hypothetical protein ACRD2N_12190, partial [Vicinamibacterales bacterium]